MQPFQVPRTTIPSQQKGKPIPGRLPPALAKANIPKATIPQQMPEMNKMTFPPEEIEPKKETPEVTPKPEIKEIKRTIEKNPENENESPEQKHPPETDHERKFSFSPNPDPEEAPQKTRYEPPRQVEEFKDETRVSQAQLQGELKAMKELQANFGGFDIAVDDNEPEGEDQEGDNYGTESDDYVRVESNEPTDHKRPPLKAHEDKQDYEEIDNQPPNFGYGQQNQDFQDQGVYKIEEDQEELVVEEEDSYPTTKVEKEYKISTLGDPFEASPNYQDPEQLPPKTTIKPFEHEPPKIIETVKEEEDDNERPPPPRKLSNKPRYETEANEEEPESKPPMAKPFNPAPRTGPFGNKPFNNNIPRPMSQAIPSNVEKIKDPEEEDRHHKSISEPFKALETKSSEHRETTTSFKPSHHEESSDPNLYAAYKKLELELERERKNNHTLQRELDSLIHENTALKEKLAHQNIHHSSGDHSHSRLAQKDEEIRVLKEELQYITENSRLVNDHSNKIISENSKFKEETDIIVNQLNEDKNKLIEELYSLKNQFQRDYQSKVQAFESKISNLESQVQFYQENFVLLEEQLRVKDEAFNKLAMANSDYEKLMEEMLKSPYKSHTTSLNQTQSISTKIVKDKSEESHHYHQVHSNERIQEEHKPVIVESRPEPKKEEIIIKPPSQNLYPIAESGGTDQIEIYHNNPSHDEIPDQVRFDSVREDEELEKPPMKSSPMTSHLNQAPPKAQYTQSNQQIHKQPQQEPPLSQQINFNQPESTQNESFLPPPTTHQQPSNSNNNTSNLMAAPQYRMPHKKGAEPTQRKPIPFTPQNVQIISGKAIDNTNPLTETEEDKRETPRRENASNASTPTREESIKQQIQQAPPQTKEFNQPNISHPITHTQPQQSKVINLSQKPKMGKNPFAEPEETDLGSIPNRDEPELNPEHLVTPPTRSALQQQQPSTNVNPFADSKTGSSNKPKETKFDPTPKSKKLVLTQNIISNDAAEDFFDQLGQAPPQATQQSSRGFNIGGQRAFDDSHKNLSLHGEDPSHRESATSVHSVVSNKTDDIKPNPKVIPVAVKKKMTSMANMFE